MKTLVSESAQDVGAAATQAPAFSVVGATLAGYPVEGWMMAGSAVLLVLNIAFVGWRLLRLSKGDA